MSEPVPVSELGTRSREVAPGVDFQKEKEANEFRAEKRANSPYLRAVLQVIRDDPSIWDKVEPTEEQQRALEKNVAKPGETHRIGAALFSNIYRDRSAAVAIETGSVLVTYDRHFYNIPGLRLWGEQ